MPRKMLFLEPFPAGFFNFFSADTSQMAVFQSRDAGRHFVENAFAGPVHVRPMNSLLQR
jgi:hypothetical protein